MRAYDIGLATVKWDRRQEGGCFTIVSSHWQLSSTLFCSFSAAKWAGPSRPGCGELHKPPPAWPPPCVCRSWSKLGRRVEDRAFRPHPPLPRPPFLPTRPESLPSTGEQPEQEVHAECGSGVSDLPRNRETHREPLTPITRPLLPPPGCPAAAGTVLSLLCWRWVWHILTTVLTSSMIFSFRTHWKQPQKSSSRS